MGRPTLYTPELAGLICTKLADGQSLRSICEPEDMPDEKTVRTWALEDYQGFSPQYAKAREQGYLRMADDLLEIADDGRNDFIARQGADGSATVAVDHDHISRSRLRVDTRKWLLSKVLPKVFGDKVALTDPDGGPLKVQVVKFADRHPPE